MATMRRGIVAATTAREGMVGALTGAGEPVDLCKTAGEGRRTVDREILHLRGIRDFEATARRRSEPSATAEAGVRSRAMALAAVEAADAGREVTLETGP